MNTNVGDMPIEIFGDYVSDTLGIEFTWEYMSCLFNDDGIGSRKAHGNGTIYNNNCENGNGNLLFSES